jgi:LacI family transcriptional regulator
MVTVKNHRRQRPHVALIVETSLASGRAILRGVARYVRRHGPWALFYQPRSLEEAVPKWLRQWRGDGIIVRVQNRKIAEAVLAAGLPAVDVLGVVPGLPLPLVHVDDAQVARLAAAHLLERGFQHFGFFGIEGENWSHNREQAFVEAVLREGGSAQVYNLPRGVETFGSWEAVEDDLAAWITRLPKPAGLMVCSDQRGPLLLEACRRAGVAVPDELTIIGVDNDEPLCEVCNPPLSSVVPNHEQVGYEAAALLERLMAGQAPPEKPVLVAPAGVVTRLSSDTLAIEDRQVAAALRLIREHACEGLKVNALARQVGLSRTVLQRRFRAVLRKSVHQLIIEARLKRAQDLIVNTDLPMIEIAERCGFKHVEYLCAVFKQRLGMPPRQLRRPQSQRPRP